MGMRMGHRYLWLGLGRMWLGRLPLLRFLVRLRPPRLWLWLPRQWVLWLRQWLPRLWQRLSREWLSEWTSRRASFRGSPFKWIRRWECRLRRKASGWSAWRCRTAWRTRWDYGRRRTFGRINRLLGASTWCADNEIRLRGNSSRSQPLEPSRNNFVLGTPNGRGSASQVHIHVVCSKGWPDGGPAGWRSVSKLVGCLSSRSEPIVCTGITTHIYLGRERSPGLL